MALTIEDRNSSPTSVFDQEDRKQCINCTDTKTMAVSLPQDVILFQILTRVPPESVIRFTCVAKQWYLFLKSDRFKEMHNRNHLKDQKFFLISKGRFCTIDCESLPIKALCLHPFPEFEASPPQYMCVLTSYHGLVCLRIETDEYQDDYFIFWNPLTTEFKKLSRPSNSDHMECYNVTGCRYGLYYRSSEDDYKLLVVTHSRNVYIYSLKSDSWRKLTTKSPFKDTNCWGPSLCWEENLYYLLNYANPSLIRFDTNAERFHVIEIPLEYHNTCNRQFSTTVHKGSIHLCFKYNINGRTGFINNTCMDLWKFNADGDIWSKVVTYQLGRKDDIGCMFPVHLMSNGNWLMQDYRGKGRMFQVELKKKYTQDKDGHDEYRLYYSNFEGYTEKVGYTETFVSPHRI